MLIEDFETRNTVKSSLYKDYKTSKALEARVSSRYYYTVADPDLRIRGGGTPCHPDPEIRGGGFLQKTFFGPSGAALVWSKNKRGARAS